MILYTAHISYRGSDRLYITVKNKDPQGIIFSPTWKMVMGVKHGKIGWEDYERQYRDLMRMSYRKHKDQWNRILAEPEVTFVCFCKPSSQCHRYLLADYFTRLGADYRGERSIL